MSDRIATISESGTWDTAEAVVVNIVRTSQASTLSITIKSSIDERLTVRIGKQGADPPKISDLTINAATAVLDIEGSIPSLPFDHHTTCLVICSPPLDILTLRSLTVAVKLSRENSPSAVGLDPTEQQVAQLHLVNCHVLIDEPSSLSVGQVLVSGPSNTLLSKQPALLAIDLLSSAEPCRLSFEAEVVQVYCDQGATFRFLARAAVAEVTSVNGGLLIDIPIQALLHGRPGVLSKAARIVPRFLPRESIWQRARAEYRMYRDGSSREKFEDAKAEAYERQQSYAELADVLRVTHSPGTSVSRAREEERRYRRISLPFRNSERVLLTMYSLVGYGERIRTPVLGWVATVLLTAGLMLTLGGVDNYAFLRMVTLVAAAPLEFLRQPFERPNPVGFGDGFIWMGGKVLGIIFVGAAILAGKRLISGESK